MASCLTCADLAVRRWDQPPVPSGCANGCTVPALARIAYCCCPRGEAARRRRACLTCGGTGYPIGVEGPAPIHDGLPVSEELGVCGCEAGRSVHRELQEITAGRPDGGAGRLFELEAMAKVHRITVSQAAIASGWLEFCEPGTRVPEGFFDHIEDWWPDELMQLLQGQT